jgi:hypothetical protein
MTTERMNNALELADRCWEKAFAAAPDFVERYLELAETLLMQKPAVTGDEFREFCADNGLHRPAALHPNVWVSGVRALHKGFRWIEPLTKVEPVKAHNHMPTVTLWRSKLYEMSPVQSTN